jgi:hypothetical protein
MPGEIVVRKFTADDYERLQFLEHFWHARGKAGDEAFQLALADLERYKIQPFGEARTHNMFMRATGRKRLWERLTGLGTPTLFDATNAKLGVGDSLTAVAETQTDLQAATNKLRKGMAATYPSIESSPNDHKLDLRSDFISGEAEFTWNEAATFNAAAAGDMFNRGLFSPSPGLKPSGQVWTLSTTLVIT